MFLRYTEPSESTELWETCCEFQAWLTPSIINCHRCVIARHLSLCQFTLRSALLWVRRPQHIACLAAEIFRLKLEVPRVTTDSCLLPAAYILPALQQNFCSESFLSPKI